MAGTWKLVPNEQTIRTGDGENSSFELVVEDYVSDENIKFGVENSKGEGELVTLEQLDATPITLDTELQFTIGVGEVLTVRVKGVSPGQAIITAYK